MSAKAISEQTGKELLYKYICTSSAIQNRFKYARVTPDTDWARLTQDHPWLLSEIANAKGILKNFLIEPFVPHKQEEEFYVCIYAAREGDYVLFHHEGGVDVGDVDAKAQKFLVAVDEKLSESDEAYIADLDAKSGASLKLTILNPKGRIWTMVAGGGASVVYSDTICDLGGVNELANYGEYSGAPSEQQTYDYAKTILSLMTREKHPEGKILIIGGSIANFTNVAATFKIQTQLQALVQVGHVW
ncbi:atp-citrate synthase isoform x1 [Limosa lapponica baueri]|uniref:Atp-citrate synthase isoform x1 n=1 Tax=Limosa lapponica baueri TaxID=1758121 RepID=A0A2I0TAN6_LIMLA|nr:atp-citrate synthase isoform x1 [Limosa lapponica baueri]